MVIMNDILKYNFFEKLKRLSFVEQIWLFGSRARGDNLEKSDIDIAIICPKASKKDWFEILNIVENADTLLKIDCIRFDDHNISQDLRDNIAKDKRVIYVKNPDKI